MSDPDKIDNNDEIMLERIEKIITGQVAPASPTDELYYRLAKTTTPADPNFQKQLEKRLAQELLARQELAKSEAMPDPISETVQTKQSEMVNVSSVFSGKQNSHSSITAFFTKKNINKSRKSARSQKGIVWPWQKIIVTGMSLVTLGFILAVIILIILNLNTNSSIPGNAQPGSNQTALTETAKTVSVTEPLLVLQPAFPKATPDQLEAARQILQQRATSLGLGQVEVKVDNNKLILEIPAKEDKTALANKFAAQLKIIISTGRIEFIDSSNIKLAVNDLVQTSYCITGTITTPKPGLCGISLQKTDTNQSGILNNNGQPFQTLFTNDQLDPTKVEQLKNPDGSSDFRLGLKTTALDTLKKYLTNQATGQLAVTLDRRVITVLPAKDFLSSQAQFSIKGENLMDSKLPAETVLPIIIKFGPLPFDLEVISG
jgi:hypothetical protein